MILIGGSCKASEVIEQEENPVTPGLERVQSVLETREGLDLPVKFELCAGDTIGVLGDYLKTNCPKQIGPERHDVANRIERFCVGVQGDGGRIVRGECMD